MNMKPSWQVALERRARTTLSRPERPIDVLYEEVSDCADSVDKALGVALHYDKNTDMVVNVRSEKDKDAGVIAVIISSCRDGDSGASSEKVIKISEDSSRAGFAMKFTGDDEVFRLPANIDEASARVANAIYLSLGRDVEEKLARVILPDEPAYEPSA